MIDLFDQDKSHWIDYNKEFAGGQCFAHNMRVGNTGPERNSAYQSAKYHSHSLLTCVLWFQQHVWSCWLSQMISLDLLKAPESICKWWGCWPKQTKQSRHNSITKYTNLYFKFITEANEISWLISWCVAPLIRIHTNLTLSTTYCSSLDTLATSKAWMERKI